MSRHNRLESCTILHSRLNRYWTCAVPVTPKVNKRGKSNEVFVRTKSHVTLIQDDNAILSANENDSCGQNKIHKVSAWPSTTYACQPSLVRRVSNRCDLILASWSSARYVQVDWRGRKLGTRHTRCFIDTAVEVLPLPKLDTKTQTHNTPDKQAL